MPFIKRYEEIIKKTKPISSLKLLLNTTLFSILIFIASSLYLFARRGNYDLFIANKVFAVTALFLIGFSLALSGLCYFWDFVDKKIIYRKHLGLAGFSFGIVHILVTLFLLQDIHPWQELFGDKILSTLFGIIALIIFTGLAAISNKYAVHELGSKQWRQLLSYGGYSGFILVLFHFSLLKYNGWLNWLSSYDPLLPPLSLIAIIFSVAVLVLRLILAISVYRKKEE